MRPVKTITSDRPSVTEYLKPSRMARSLFSHRELIARFAWREILGRYKGTYLGLLWSFINPLLTLAVYTLVFGIVLKVSFGTAAGSGNLDFALNFFCGLILYNVFSSCVGRASELIVENPNYVKKVVFPLEILPVAIHGCSLLDAGMGMAILIPALIVFCPELSSTLYLFPLVLIPLSALTLGVSWFVASVGVFLRDVGQVVTVLLQLLFFLSPVIYPVSAAPGILRSLLRLNPLTTILTDARRTLIGGQPPEWGWWLAVTVFALVILQLGYTWFMKTKRSFADVL